MQSQHVSAHSLKPFACQLSAPLPLLSNTTLTCQQHTLNSTLLTPPSFRVTVLTVLQGCGIVVYESITSALSAMEVLNNKYHWTGGETTMVLEWADPSRHRRENPNTKGE